MQGHQELTAAERLQAVAELFARGIDRLAMQKARRSTPRERPQESALASDARES